MGSWSAAEMISALWRASKRAGNNALGVEETGNLRGGLARLLAPKVGDWNVSRKSKVAVSIGLAFAVSDHDECGHTLVLV
jgi:hypothetical protein